ncbi:MAG: AAA family ATPase [Bacteroidales bacterium]|nr:AAA family ATPase [Bacteroidales bacterium]MBN2756156.1 AAA family ATPase [Bacteroidales bacterium]
MATIISIINYKGGTGKTTTTLNFGAALAKKRKKVLLLDFDSQCNLSLSTGVKNSEKHLGHVLAKKATIEDVIIKQDLYSIVPSTQELIDYEFAINNEPGREFIAKEFLEPIQDLYDYILIDCPPSLGTLSINSLVAADYFIVPMQPENFAFIGLDHLIGATMKVKNRMNPKLELAGILFVKFAYRTKFAQAILANILSDDNLKDKLFESYIRQDISVMESPAFHKNIFEYAPHSRGAKDFKNFANEFIKIYG